jgi:hypothetical protein
VNHLTGHIDRDALEGAFAVIHLAGKPISQRWTAAAKERILTSRRDGTRLLAETLKPSRSSSYRCPASADTVSGDGECSLP